MKITFFIFWTIAIFILGFLFSKRVKRRFIRRSTKIESIIWQSNPDGYDEELFKINYERYSEWVRASIAWMTNPQRVSTAFYNLQLLGIVDARIYGRTVEDYRTKNGWICDSNGVMLRERDMILADLWLLGAYEFVRTIDARYREKSGPNIDKAKAIIRETKKLFHRVRIPLAKNEAAKGHTETDDIAAPIGCGTKGFGWQLNKDAVVLQRVLSDSLLVMLRTVKPGWLLSEQEQKEYQYDDEQGKQLKKNKNI